METRTMQNAREQRWTMLKRKVKARNHISFALVSFSCVYVRFALPKTHPSWANKFRPLWLYQLNARCEQQRSGAHKPIYKHFHNGFGTKSQLVTIRTSDIIALHCIGLFCMHIHFATIREHACALRIVHFAIAYREDIFWTEDTTKEPKECVPMIFFSSLCSL